MRTHLNLKEKLSQVLINPWSIMLAILVLKLIIFRNSLIATIEEIAFFNQTVCNSLVEYESQMLLLTQNVSAKSEKLANYLISQVELSQFRILKLFVSTVKYMVIFYIEIFFGTFTCLIGSIFNGTVDYTLDAIEGMMELINSVILVAVKEIRASLQGFEKILNQFISVINGIKAIFSPQSSAQGEAYIQKINISTNSLVNIQIPNSTIISVDNLKNKVPQFNSSSSTLIIKDIFDKVLDSISVQQKSLKSQNKTFIEHNLIAKNAAGNMNNATIAKNNTAFAANKTNSSLCPISINSEYTNLAKDINKVILWIIISILVVWVLGLITLIFMEYRNWKFNLNMANEMHNQTNMSDLLNTLSKYSSTPMLYIHKFLGNYPKLIWLTSYAFSYSATLVLSLGLLGCLLVLIQYAFVEFISTKLFKIIDKMDSNITNSSLNPSSNLFNWVNSTNHYIISEETTQNKQVFGWVQNLTLKLSSTITKISDEVDQSISFLNGTVFYDPLQTIVYCTIGRKIQKLENGVQWAHDNIKLNIPLIPTALMNAESAWIEPQAIRAIRNFKSICNLSISKYHSCLKLELILSLIFVGIWLVQFFAGLLILWYTLTRAQKTKHANLSIEDVSGPTRLSKKEKLYYGMSFNDPFDLFK